MRRYWEADALETDRRLRDLLLGYPLYPHLVMLSSDAVSEQRNGEYLPASDAIVSVACVEFR